MSTLTIHISRDDVRLLTKTRPFIHTRKCMVKKGDEDIYLKELLPPAYEDRYETVRLALHNRFYSRRLRIPARLEEVILWYVHRPDLHRTSEDNELFCLKVAKVALHHIWKLETPGLRFRAGDILTFKKGDLTVQRAVYLGANLCIMIWEAGGSFEVTGISDIKQALGATHIMIAR